LPQSEREPLRRFVISHSIGANAKDVLGWAGTLDLTAVNAKTQEAIWFFRHRIARSRFKQTGMRFLFRKDGATSPYEIWRPQGVQEAVTEADDRSAEDYEQTQLLGGPADPFKAEKHALARDVARACVALFSGRS